MKCFVLLSGCLLFAATADARALRIITEEWAPFNYHENGQLAGLAVEMVQTKSNRESLRK